MEPPRVHVQATGGFLKRALELFLRSTLGDRVAIVDAGERADVILTVDSCCPPAVCQRLARLTPAVIVLAALPRPADEDSYVRAGAAAYLPMDVRADSLLEVMNNVLVHAAGA